MKSRLRALNPILAPALLACLAAGTASANSITYTESLTQAIFPQLEPAPFSLDVLYTGHIAKFDPSLGTLNSISIGMSASATRVITILTPGVHNPASLAVQSVTNALTFRDPNSPTIVNYSYTTLSASAQNRVWTDSVAADPNQRPVSFYHNVALPAQTAVYYGSGPNAGKLQSYDGLPGAVSSSINLGLFTGSGFATFELISSQTSSVRWSGGGSSSFSITGDDRDTTLTVTYDYTPRVPEPITLVSLGSGLFVMGMLGRRRSTR